MLSLSVVLMSVFSYLFVQANVSGVLLKSFNQYEQQSSIHSSSDDHAVTIQATHPDSEKELVIEATETEEEEEAFHHSHKTFTSSVSFTALFYALILSYLISNAENSIAYFKHLSDTAKNRWFIYFSVFRL